jgi:hypothetical protein
MRRKPALRQRISMTKTPQAVPWRDGATDNQSAYFLIRGHGPFLARHFPD